MKRTEAKAVPRGDRADRADRAELPRGRVAGRFPGPAAEIAHVSASAPVDVPRVLSRRQYLDLIQGGD
jgi:hypothetical protein